MPTYRWRCDEGHEWEQWQSIKDDTVPSCDCRAPVQKVLTVPRISVMATPHKGHDAKTVIARESRWDRDMPQYKAMRQQGLQPRGIDGCADLASRASDPLEIEVGHIVGKKDMNHAHEIHQELAQSAREGSFATEYGKHVRSG